MDNKILVDIDSCFTERLFQIIESTDQMSLLDQIYTWSTISIAVINIVLVIIIFCNNKRDNKKSSDNARKLDLFKTLVLDYNLKYLYRFFDNISTNSSKLKQSDLSNDEKSDINDENQQLSEELRRRFTDILLAIDKKLYDNVISLTDMLVDGMTENIFDEGVNLSYGPKYDELIQNKISYTKTNMIKLLFNYSPE